LVFVEAETRNVRAFWEQRAVIAMAAQPQKIVRSSACEVRRLSQGGVKLWGAF